VALLVNDKKSEVMQPWPRLLFGKFWTGPGNMHIKFEVHSFSHFGATGI